MRYEMISADCHLDLCWLPQDLFTANAAAGSLGSALRSPTFLLASVTMSFRRCSSRPENTRKPRPRSSGA